MNRLVSWVELVGGPHDGAQASFVGQGAMTCVCHPDGAYVVAFGVDLRLRAHWEVLDAAD